MRDARERLLKRCRETIAPLAVNVDRDARFPEESLTALREERLLAAAFPEDLGGSGATLTELVELCETTARACASTGMVLAMHFIQALCICQHGRRQPFFANYAAHAAREQLLLASATSEEGVDGNMRASIAAIREAPPRFSLAKRCTTVSYGEHADALLITARRSESASPSDQVIVLLRKADFRAQLLRPWNTLGMRGTCSPAMLIEAEAALEQIFETPFHVIASQTMTPAAHLLWSSVWLGIAGDALDRTMRLVRSRTHATAPGERLGRSRLLETVATFHALRAYVLQLTREFAELNGAAGVAALQFTLSINALKIEVSRRVLQICIECLQIAGMRGYANDGPGSLGRHIRDASSGPLMISNYRILEACADMMLLSEGLETQRLPQAVSLAAVGGPR